MSAKTPRPEAGQRARSGSIRAQDTRNRTPSSPPAETWHACGLGETCLQLPASKEGTQTVPRRQSTERHRVQTFTLSSDARRCDRDFAPRLALHRETAKTSLFVRPRHAAGAAGPGPRTAHRGPFSRPFTLTSVTGNSRETASDPPPRSAVLFCERNRRASVNTAGHSPNR